MNDDKENKDNNKLNNCCNCKFFDKDIKLKEQPRSSPTNYTILEDLIDIYRTETYNNVYYILNFSNRNTINKLPKFEDKLDVSFYLSNLFMEVRNYAGLLSEEYDSFSNFENWVLNDNKDKIKKEGK